MDEKNILYNKELTLENIGEFVLFLKNIFTNKDIFILNGDLGYGKTTLVRSIANSMNTSSIVSSPTFTIINEYDILLSDAPCFLRHVDLYRLGSIDEAYNIGLIEMIDEDGITFVEWGEKFIQLFQNYFVIDISMIDENTRKFVLYKN